ncbi:ankyrin repeat-containing domain protein [Daldinia eschscholtzii]|nr:ankyrin repeat-containing domain protein [Daldinia eschscholtzii]
MCYFFGKGTSSNLEAALTWLRASALCGLKKAMHVASMISTRTLPQYRFPIRLWLSLLALSGSDLALERLYQWTELSKKVREIIQEKRLAYKTIETQGGDMLYLHSLAPYHHDLTHVGDPITTIQQAIEFKAIPEMEQILEGSTEVQDQDLLHQLVHLIDAETLPLAREAFVKGAKLDALIECQSTMLGVKPLIDIVYSPLSSAIIHGKQELAIEIFCFHIESDTPIIDFPTALFLSFRYLQHEVGELLLGLLQSNPSMCRNDTMPWIFDEAHLYSLSTLAMSWKTKEAPLHHLLFYTMHHDSLSELERQAFSGEEFDARYQTCLEILLERGADPTEGLLIHCPLYCALVNDDLVGLRLFVEHIESRQPNETVIFNHLRNPGKRGSDNNQWPALLVCIRHNSVRCFEFLIRKFPVLKFDRVDGQGNTLLVYACSNSLNTDFVKLLIEDGIDTTAMDFSNGLFNPLLVALTKGHLSAADLIADRCSPDELERYLSQDDQGVSIFCCILVEATRTELTSSVKWLIDRGGAHFYGPHGTPIWYALFAESRPTSHEDQMRRAELLETMLGNEMFSTRLNTECYQGFMLLHILALNGHIEAIKRFVKLGGDVNAVLTISDSTAGCTALDIVNAQLSGENYPPEIKAGGRIEMKRWVEDLHKIIKLLRDAGCGGYNHSVVPLEEILEYSLMFTKHRRFQGDWPLPLPSEGSSNWLQDFIDNKIASAGIEKDAFDLFVDNVEHDLEMNKHKSIKKSDADHDHPESSMGSRQTAQFLRKTWRLPPEWGYVTAGGMIDMTFYVNHETGEMTEQKPSLYRGEDGVGRPYDRKGKGKAPETTNDKAERTRRMFVITAPPKNSIASSTESSATKEGHNVFVIFDDPDTQDEFSKTFNGLSLIQMVTNKIMLRVGSKRDLIPGYKAFVDKTQDVIRKSWSDLPPKPDETLEEITYEMLCKGSIEKLKAFIKATDMVEKERYLDSTPYPLVNLMKPLHDAIVNKRWEEFETLVETSDIESENHAGYTPLHWAILLDHRDMVRTLLAHGANTDKAISRIDIPPLHYSLLNEDIQMTKLLLEFGADPNGKTPDGVLPLQLCNLTNQELTTLLIEKGANISMARKAYLEQTAPSRISQRSLDIMNTYVSSWESHAESSLVSLQGGQINDAATSSYALSSPDDDASLLSRT